MAMHANVLKLCRKCIWSLFPRHTVLVLSMLFKSVGTEYINCVFYVVDGRFSIVQFVTCWISWLEFLQKWLLPVCSFLIVLHDILCDIITLSDGMLLTFSSRGIIEVHRTAG